jgi:predicted helicase
LDLGGNVRKTPKLSGTTHNVFGIQVGVSITILIRQVGNDTQKPAEIYYARMKEDWRKEQKFTQLATWGDVCGLQWQDLKPDTKNTWLTEGQEDGFSSLMALGDKAAKAETNPRSLFIVFSLGVASNRDAYNYNFGLAQLRLSISSSVESYNETLARYSALIVPRPEPDFFVDTDDQHLKWTRQTKAALSLLHPAQMEECFFRVSLYRPFSKMHFYFADFWNEERYQQHHFFPVLSSENRVIVATSPGSEKPFMAIAADCLVDLHLVGPGAGSQTFAF